MEDNRLFVLVWALISLIIALVIKISLVPCHG